MVPLTPLPDNPAVLSRTSSEERRIACIAGIRPMPNSPQNQVWIRSPRTGRELSVADGWFPELKATAPQLVAKVVHARSTGRAVVDLTAAELRAFASLAATIAERCKPKPGFYSGYRHKPGRRRGWISK